MDPPIPPEAEADLRKRMGSIEEALRKIGETLTEISRLCEIQRAQERRLNELEATVNRINGIVMDLKQSQSARLTGGDRLDLLEAAVKKITLTADEQRSLLESQLSEQRRLMEELKRGLTRGVSQEEEPAILEIDDLFRRKRR